MMKTTCEPLVRMHAHAAQDANQNTSMQKAAQHQQAASRSKTDMDATGMCSAMTKLVTLMLTIAPDFPQ